MKKIYLLFFLFVFCCGISFSQNPLVKQWDARYGGETVDGLFSLQQTADGGYILGGISFSGIYGDKTQASKGSNDYWVVKIDSLGNKQWDRDFGGINSDNLRSLQQTTDGGYILGGYSSSGISGDKTQASKGGDDFWVVKIDSLGNKQWDKDFGGSDDEDLYSLQQTHDGGYILGGFSLSGIGGDKTQASRGGWDFWIVKIDSLGNKQWDRDFGGTGTDEFFSLQQAGDRGYILGGVSTSGIGGDKTQATNGAGDYWVVKTDSLGNKQWDKDFGGIGDDELNYLCRTKDGGYFLGGISNSGIGGDKTQASHGDYDYRIVKIDSLGNKLWDRDFGGTGIEDAFRNLSQTSDGGCLMAGTSYSALSGGDKTENNLGQEQTWVLKMDLYGNKQWDKTIFTTGHDETGYAIQTKDGCYTVVNSTSAGTGGYKTQASQGAEDYWIIKFCDTTSAALPKSNFISSDTTFCGEPGKCISFFDHSTNNPSSWKWLFPGANPNFSNQQNPTNICYGTPGTYPVSLIVTNAAGTDSLTVPQMIIVGSAPPSPTLWFSHDTVFSSHASTYQWYFNGSIIAGATDSFYVYTSVGTYAVNISDGKGCNTLSGGLVITGISPLSFGEGLGVRPNPVSDEFTVYGLQLSVGTTLEVYNVFGEKVYSHLIEGGNKKQETINCKQFSPGIYFVKITNEKMNWVGKFVKE